mmetsp:Transcript_23818/g.33561  ORF Transcript_23818/g.33561 Transcript_23818/m.33561 type:complete len:256 (+) Transcript_23818:1369-2136(+)
MERNVVFPHKLHQLNILRIFPPLFPLVCVVGCDGQVADRSIEPHVEDFVCKAIERNRCAPLQVSRDTARFQAVTQPALSCGDGVLRPVPFDLGVVDERGQLGGQLGQIQKQVSGGLFGDFDCWVHLGFGIDQLSCIEESPASVTLVSSGVVVPAFGARTADEAISQKAQFWAPQLHHVILSHAALVVGFDKDILSNHGLVLGRRATKMIKIDVKPLVNFRVDGIVVVTYLLRSGILLQGFGFCCSSVLVGATHID